MEYDKIFLGADYVHKPVFNDNRVRIILDSICSGECRVDAMLENIATIEVVGKKLRDMMSWLLTKDKKEEE